MRKKLFTFLLALTTSVGVSWATDPIVIETSSSQSSYTQGTITITCSKPGDSDGFFLQQSDNETATITVSGSSTISQIVLGIGWFPQYRSNVRANGAEPTSSDEYSITFSNVNSNNVTLSITTDKIQIRDVTITLADEGGSTPTPTEPAIVITTNTEQSSYTQGNITITCSKPGDSDGFYLEKSGNETATITVSGSSTISQIELGIGWYPDYRSYVRANGAEPTSSDEYSITFSNVNSNNVTLTITDVKIQIRDVTITLANEGGSASDPTPGTAYNSDVNLSNLQVGDILCVDAVLNGSSDWTLKFVANRYMLKYGDDILTSDLVFSYDNLAGSKFVHSAGEIVVNVGGDYNTYRPVDINGIIGDRWIVTAVGTNTISLAGYRITIPGDEEVVVIPTNTLQSSYTQGGVTITPEDAGYADYGFLLYSAASATITTSGTITKVELVPGSNKSYHESVNANGTDPTTSSEDLITFTNINSNEVILTADYVIYIEEVRVTVVGGGSTPTPATSGSCGANVTWEFVPSTGALTITGTGAMDDYLNNASTPWNSYIDDITSVTITDGVTNVGNHSFEQCTSLTTVTIGDDVETIGTFAFSECGEQFTTLTLGNSIRTIGNQAFASNNGITGFTLPSSLETIGNYAFIHSKAITTLTIPSNVTSIDVDAFYGCTAVTDVYCYPNAADLTWDDGDCDDFKSGKATICHVNADQLDAYQTKFNDLVRVTFVGDLDAPAPANPVIKLNADFGGVWADTEAFTDNGNGKASWTISTLTAGEWYHFGVKVDDTWTSDNAAFDREHPSRAISGTGDAMWFQADVAGEYTFTWEYATNTLTIGFPNVVPTVAMKGSWDGWADEVNFSDNGNGTASVTKTFEHEGYYTFKTVLGSDDWRGNGEAFKRNYTGAEGITGNTDMTLWVDAKGEYTFTWTYASNRIDITYPALPTVYVNGEWDWEVKSPFTVNSDGTASFYMHFNSTGSNRAFKIRVGNDDWRSNGQTFNPVNTTYDWINENNASDMKIYVDAEADYTFTWTYVENKLEITHPVVPDYPVTTKQDPVNLGVYYSTFYSSSTSYKLMNDGTEAFIAKISGGDLVLTQIAEGEQVIPKGTAVIFRKTGSSIPVGLRVTEENNTSFDPADNDLRGVDHNTEVTSIDGLTRENCYVLSGTAQYGVGFYKIDSDELIQHKAYVKYVGGSNNAPKKMRFVYGQATGIEDVQGNNVQSTKVIENGVLYIIRDGKTYNAMGQMVK